MSRELAVLDRLVACCAVVVVMWGVITQGAIAIAEDAAGAQAAAPAVEDLTKPIIKDPQDMVVRIRLDGPVDEVMSSSLQRRVAEARKAGATLIIYDINTNGGLLLSALEMSKFTKRLDVPTVAYINDHAYSAGSIIALSCNQIIMADHGTLGDCEPIRMTMWGGAEAIPTDLRAKIASPLLEDMEESARRQGIDPLMVHAMVEPEVEVFELKNNLTGKYKYADSKGRDALLAEMTKSPEGKETPTWRLTQTIDGPNTLLTVDPDVAGKLGISKRTIHNDSELLAALNVRKTMLPLDYSWSEVLTRFLVEGWVRTILFVMMLIFAYIEFTHPGVLIPAVLAMLCLGLLVGAPYLTGLAQTWELIIILVGVGIIIMDVIAFGGVGLLAAPGFILVAVGIVFSFVPAGGGDMEYLPALQQGLSVVIFGTLGASVVMVVLAKYFDMTPGLRHLRLQPAMAPTGRVTVVDSMEREVRDAVFAGAIGRVSTGLRPAGKATFGDHVVDVVGQTFVEAGREVEVVEVRGNRVVVKERNNS